MDEGMTDDLTLLRAYAKDGAEDAFQTVVERHLGLVHSAALRQVGDPHLAQEVTQAVFLILARKAASLKPATILAGWLFRTTRFAASQALRAARRRRRYEQEAAQMQPTTTPDAPEVPWEDVAPHLDEAVAGLGDSDRHAILLRFFERKEMKEVGSALGSTEDAAKKRVGRALDKLRHFLGRRGIALSAAALGSALMTNAVQATPTPLYQAIAATVAADGIAATTTLELAIQTMKAMFLTQLQKAAVIAVLLLVAVGLGSLFAHVPAQSSASSVPSNQPSADAPAVTPPSSDTVLAWDANERKHQAAPGEMNVPFTFWYTNVSTADVVIHGIRLSCGCTKVNNGPVLPHRIAPGESDQIEVSMNLAGKSGSVVKTVTVETSAGTKTLLLRVEIPAASSPNGFTVPGPAATVDTDARRAAGMAAATADRQAIFKGDCAKCHVEPATGKEGKELYAASCGICHDAEHRASMVPDLKALSHPTSPEYWLAMITHGKPGTLMPAFSEKNGGNLTDTQIASLVKHLSRTIPVNPTPTKAASAP